MTNFPVHSLESAPTQSRPLLENIHRALGFVPNLYAVFAESPAALRGALAIGDAFSKSTLSLTEQQLVALAASVANSCAFCVAAHSTLARQIAKADPALVAATRNGESLPDAKLNALVTFTRKLVERRGLLSDAEVNTFLLAGYTKAQAIEVLLGVGMKTLNNYMDHLAHVPLNDQFKGEAWEPTRHHETQSACVE
jgi:uncharacterized peroxidase-related enzyme